MYSIKVFNAISEKGLSLFDQDQYRVSADIDSPQAILCRSADLHQASIADSVLVVGRAGAGTNNIPVETLTERGIAVLNTPGANANAVKELVITGMLLACRHIFSAWQYVCELNGSTEEQQQQVEKDKKQFIGMELPGKTLAVIGLGHIGVAVANSARYLGMNVIGYDPHMSVKNAWKLSSSVKQADSLAEVVSAADFISLHVPLLAATENLIDSAMLAKLKPGVVLLNFARSPLVSAEALQQALAQEIISRYVCDFPLPALKQDPRVICLPHLGASTVEAQENCAVMVAEQVKAFLQDGHIINSVNFPSVKMSRSNGHRLAIVNRNVPNMVAQISTVISNSGINIIDMINKSRDDIAYTLLDVDTQVTSRLMDDLCLVDGIVRARVVG